MQKAHLKMRARINDLDEKSLRPSIVGAFMWALPKEGLATFLRRELPRGGPL